MARIHKVKVGRYTYYRLVESRRVNGTPRPVPVLHVGPADQLLQRLRAPSAPSLRVRSSQHGDVAALKAMAERLGLGALIDRSLPYARRPLSIGTTLLLAALHRAIWPCSKRSWAQWAERTSGPHLFALQPAALTRQDVWDQLDVVSETALEAIAAELTRRVIEACALRLDTLFYDTSQAHQALVAALPVHYVASLVPAHHAALMAIPTSAYTPLGPGALAGRHVYRCRRPLWGAERTLVLSISPT